MKLFETDMICHSGQAGTHGTTKAKNRKHHPSARSLTQGAFKRWHQKTPAKFSPDWHRSQSTQPLWQIKNRTTLVILRVWLTVLWENLGNRMQIRTKPSKIVESPSMDTMVLFLWDPTSNPCSLQCQPKPKASRVCEVRCLVAGSTDKLFKLTSSPFPRLLAALLFGEGVVTVLHWT